MYTRSRVATSGSNENHKVTNKRQWLCLLHYNFCKPTFTLKNEDQKLPRKTANFNVDSISRHSNKTYLQLNTLWPVHNLHIKYSGKMNPKILSKWPEKNI